MSTDLSQIRWEKRRKAPFAPSYSIVSDTLIVGLVVEFQWLRTKAEEFYSGEFSIKRKARRIYQVSSTTICINLHYPINSDMHIKSRAIDILN
jgi:hypothetical protein